MKRRSAVALSYPEGVEAPLIIARGKNELADRMLEIAKECGIQIISDRNLADILSDAEIGLCIPAQAYTAVASIFAFLEKGISEKWFTKS